MSEWLCVDIVAFLCLMMFFVLACVHTDQYDDGDVFNTHVDGDWPGYGVDEAGMHMVEWEGCRSKLSMLLYLNGADEGVQGGETRLFSRRDPPDEHDVCPKKGAALFFRHGFGPASVLHRGNVVRGPVAKYLARINVLYAE